VGTPWDHGSGKVNDGQQLGLVGLDAGAVEVEDLRLGVNTSASLWR
jgi:hypothetical protein